MKKPIVLVIMDGVGRGDGGPGDAVKQANTPTLDKLMATCPITWLKAHGTAVGLPTDDDMGNSEVAIRLSSVGVLACLTASPGPPSPRPTPSIMTSTIGFFIGIPS